MNREQEMSLLIGMLFAIACAYQHQFNDGEKEEFKRIENAINRLFYSEIPKVTTR